MSTGMRVVTDQGHGIIVGWQGMFHCVVHLDDGRTIVVLESVLRNTR